jgi:hypothetical protein
MCPVRNVTYVSGRSTRPTFSAGFRARGNRRLTRDFASKPPDCDTTAETIAAAKSADDFNRMITSSERVQYMFHRGKIVFDVDGEQRAAMTVTDLLYLFRRDQGEELADDVLLLG